MTWSVMATWNGESVHPDEPLPLTPGTRVNFTVRLAEFRAEASPLVPADIESPRNHETFAEAVRRIRIDGPPDWSSRVDHYLYGWDDEPSACDC